MTRKKVLKALAKLLKKEDLVFCVGKYLVQESNFPIASVYYATDINIDYLSVALGLAMTCKNRVIFICEDSYFMKEFSSVIQASISNCSNLYIMVVRTGSYSPALKQGTLTDALRSLKGTLFNLGFLVHDYSPYMETVKDIAKFCGIVNTSIGPLVGMFKVDNLRLYDAAKHVLNDITPIIDAVFDDEVEA